MKQLALGVRLRDEAVFDSYAEGLNAEPLAALRALSGVQTDAKGAGAAPIWLWGGHGAGKTHLLQAACAAAAASAYFPLDRSLSLPPEALLGFERSPVLCIDDVDAVVGDGQWEEVLFQLFNEAIEQRTQLIFAAQLPPRQLLWQLEDWRSRAAASVVYQLRELDDAGRVEALRLRAAQRGLQLPPETVEYLLRRMPRDSQTLFDILDQLDEASLIAQRRLTVPFIRAALQKLEGTKP